MAASKLEGILESNPTTANKIFQWIEQQANFDQQQKKKPCTFHGGICHHDCLLPSFYQMSPDMLIAYKACVLDNVIMEELENAQVINWSKSVTRFYTVNVAGDGDCLLHSAAFAIWGVDDRRHILRKLLLTTLQNDHNHVFRARWWKYRSSQLQGIDSASSAVIDREWNDLVWSSHEQRPIGVSSVIPPKFLESVHVYVLANILRRPIIILSDPIARSVYGINLHENHMNGIYLPLEWNPSECNKTPLIFGFSFHCSHFCPLISCFQTKSSKSPYLFPLVTRDLIPLPIRYLKESEESHAWKLLQKYLIVKEVSTRDPHGNETNILCSILSLKLMPFDRNTIELHFQKFTLQYSTVLVHSEQRRSQQHPVVSTNSMQKSKPEIRLQVKPGTGMDLTNPFYPIQFNSQTRLNSNIRPVNTAHNERIQAHQGMRSAENKLTVKENCISEGCEQIGHIRGLCNSCLKNYPVAEAGAELVSIHEGDRNIYTLKNTPEEPAQVKVTTVVNSEINVTPTAPPMSRNLESSNLILSMMNVRCQNGDCGYRCSQHTYPYCHECYTALVVNNTGDEIHKAKVIPINIPFTSNIVNTADVNLLNRDITAECAQQSNALEHLQLLDVKFPPTNKSSSVILSHMSTTSLAQPKLVVQEYEPMGASTEISCQKTGQDDMEVSMEPIPVSPEFLKCVAPQCAAMVKFPNMLCKKCEEIIIKNTPSASHSPEVIELLHPESFAERRPANSTLHIKMHRSEHCIIAGCDNFGDPANDNMCSFCYRKIRKRQGGLSSEKTHQTGMLKPWFMEPISNAESRHTGTPNVYPEHLSASPYQLFSKHTHCTGGNQSPQSVPKRTEENQAQLRVSNMSQFIEPEMTSLIVTSLSRAQDQMSFIPTVAGQNPSTFSATAIDHTPSSKPAILPADREYENFLKQFELETESERILCRADLCPNFGSVANGGFCNACYPVYKLQEEEFLRHKWPDDVIDHGVS